MPTAAI